jgi:membrane-bound lytic murein transglycosylase
VAWENLLEQVLCQVESFLFFVAQQNRKNTATVSIKTPVK